MTTQPIDSRPHLPLQWILTVTGVTGIPAIFLPFTVGTSPWAAAFGGYGLWQIALPAFLSLPVTYLLMRWLIAKKLLITEQLIACLLSIASAFTTLAVYVKDMTYPADLKEWVVFILPLLIICSGIFILVRIRNKKMFNPYGAILCLQLAYLANCVLSLGAFIGEWQSGAYLIMLTVTAYLIQLILVLKGDPKYDAEPGA